MNTTTIWFDILTLATTATITQKRILFSDILSHRCVPKYLVFLDKNLGCFFFLYPCRSYWDPDIYIFFPISHIYDFNYIMNTWPVTDSISDMAITSTIPRPYLLL